MKEIRFLLLGMILISSVTSCSRVSQADVDATVQAGIAGTQAAEFEMDSAIEEAVAATLTAMPTPTALAVEEISEEEFAQAVESSASEAVETSEEAAAASESAVEDGQVSEDELEDLYYLYYLTLEEVEQALYLAEEYYALYADLLDATLDELEQLEQELQSILDTADEVVAVLDEINQVLQQGSAAAQQALENLAQLSQQVEDKAGTLAEHLPAWQETRGREFEQLAGGALQVSPSEIAETRAGALAQARDYLQAVQSAAGDGRFSLEELQSVSQLGANAAASFGRLGGDLAGLPDMINGLTNSFARGQLPQVNLGVGSLQNSLPSIR